VFVTLSAAHQSRADKVQEAKPDGEMSYGTLNHFSLPAASQHEK